MKIPFLFRIFPQTQEGEVYGTNFTFESNLPPQYNKFAWNFGDGTGIVYNQTTVNHIYKYPGIYTVSLSSWTDIGLPNVDVATVDVDYVYRDSVLFTGVPDSFSVPGVLSQPFTVSVTSSKIDQPLSLVLQSFNSKSVPNYAVPQKWKFITPTWSFRDADNSSKELEGPLQLSSIPIYNSEGRVIAVKAEKKFFYVDDLSTGLDPEKDCPLMILATLSTERFSYPPESIIYPYASYSNSEVTRAVISWQINDLIPTSLSVTENFIQETYPTKWATVPIPVMITLQSDTALIGSYALTEKLEGGLINNLAYPRTNEMGKANNVNLRLSSNQIECLSGVHYRIDDVDKYGGLNFRATDEYGNIASGYIFTTITPLTTIPGDVRIVADTVTTNTTNFNVDFAFPVGYPIQPHAYISHPLKSVINRIDIAYKGITCPEIEVYRSLGILVEGSFTVIPVPSTTNIQTSSTNLIENYSLSGTGGNVYALTFNPFNNRLYTADVDFGTISCYEAGLVLLTSVELQHRFKNADLAPTHITVDAQGFVWVALFDNFKILKFDQNLNFLLSAAPPLEDNNMVVEEDVVPYDEFISHEENYFETGVLNVEDPLIADTVTLRPPVIEADRQSNVWVCYPSDTESSLFKFDSQGFVLTYAPIPKNSFPVSLSIGADNSVWVALKNSSKVVKYSTTGTLMYQITGVLSPSYICHDREGNVCILHGYNLYSYYDLATHKMRTWRMAFETEVYEEIPEYTPKDIQMALYEDEVWGGLSTDVYNRVWIVDSLNNATAVFRPRDVTFVKTIRVSPAGSYTNYVIQGNDTFVSTVSVSPAQSLRSAQAGGDWTGNRWYQRYGSGLTTRSVNGVSSPFKVYDLEDSFKITKVNESWNCAEHYKSLALPDLMQSYLSFFNELLPGIVGDGDPSKESVGRVTYERIANFINNHGDLETVAIPQLKALAEQIAVETKTFGVEFPVAVERLVHLFSIHKNRLRGLPQLETDISVNIGEVLTASSAVTANMYYYFKDKKFDRDYLVYVNIPPGEASPIFPLEKITVDSLRQPVLENYHVFTYKYDNVSRNESSSVIYTGNIIDWNENLTTLSYNVSSNEEWYGDNGIIETMFNNLLTKQLFL